MKRLCLFLAAAALFIAACQVPISKAQAQTMVPFEMMPDSLGHTTTLVPPASQFVTNHALTANTARTITVPTGANWVSFSPQANLWVNFSGGTAAVPSSDLLTGNGSYFKPPMTYIGPVYAGGAMTYPAITSISVISDTSWTLTIMWYR